MSSLPPVGSRCERAMTTGSRARRVADHRWVRTAPSRAAVDRSDDDLWGRPLSAYLFGGTTAL
jgi:hypothetical protein